MAARTRPPEQQQDRRSRARSRRFEICIAVCALVLGIALMSPSLAENTPPGTVLVGSRELFTDTGIKVHAGQKVTITASGTVRFGGGKIRQLSPAGMSWGGVCTSINHGIDRGKPWPAPGVPCWSLIARIGSGHAFGIGAKRSFHAGRSGELFLGNNDNVPSDNSGWWTARVAVAVPKPKVALTPVARPPSFAAQSAACVGTPMTQGQSDINAAPAGTTFCLSGTHNWTLSPKSGDKLIGPATLNGANSAQFAINAGSASNVELASLEIENYTPGDQQGAIEVTNPSSASGWTLLNDQVHDNGTVGGTGSAGGAGSNLGDGWQVIGGRYYNNRQEGFGGAIGNNVVLNSVRIDHNNFTNDSYTTANIDCGYEAGGFKWVANNVTVENSTIDDNACKGLWSDINSNGAVIKNNVVSNNWGEGIFLEISSNATVTANTVTGNAFHDTSGSCVNDAVWMFGGGITLAASDHVTVTGNNVSGNCNGITGVQQSRPDGHPGMLEDDTISGNSISGPGGRTGAATDEGSNLAAQAIVFSNNTNTNGMSFCNLSC
jgi:parallel beta-helix repeat protein